MSRSARTLGALLLALATAAAASATEAYVPLAVRVVERGVVERTELLALNTQPSLAQRVLVEWRPSDGGRGRRRALTLEPGAGALLDSLVPSGRRGVLVVDAPYGVVVTARRVTERPGRAASVVQLPVVESRSAAPPGTRLLLQGLENRPGEAGSGLALLNLEGRAARCELTLRDDSGGGAATLALPVAGGSQVLLDDLFGLFGAVSPAGASAALECDRTFWAIARVSDEIEGGARLVAPAFESIAAATSNHSLSGNGTPSTFFTLPGLFLTSNSGNTNWQYDMHFSETKTFRKVKLDFDVYVSGWDPDPLQYFHCLFWLNNSNQWSKMMGYLNALGAKNQSRLEVNFPTFIAHSRNGGVQPGGTYHVHYEMDFVGKQIWYRISEDGSTVLESSYGTTANDFSTSFMFVEFGTQIAPDGPEGHTYGWQFSNFVAEYVP